MSKEEKIAGMKSLLDEFNRIRANSIAKNNKKIEKIKEDLKNNGTEKSKK